MEKKVEVEKEEKEKEEEEKAEKRERERHRKNVWNEDRVTRQRKKSRNIITAFRHIENN